MDDFPFRSTLFLHFGIPNEITVLLYSVAVFAVLAAFISGRKLGNWQFPELSRTGRLAAFFGGAILFASCVTASVPLNFGYLNLEAAENQYYSKDDSLRLESVRFQMDTTGTQTLFLNAAVKKGGRFRFVKNDALQLKMLIIGDGGKPLGAPIQIDGDPVVLQCAGYQDHAFNVSIPLDSLLIAKRIRLELLGNPTPTPC